MRKALILTTTSGFLSQFELDNVKLLQERGYQVHYATNFGVPVYEVKDEALKRMGIVLHHISIQKSPFHIQENIWAYRELKRIIDREGIDVVHCHNPVGGLLGRLASHAVKRRPTVIYTAHGFHFFQGASWKNWLYYPVEKYLARMTDILITINHEDYDRACTFRLKEGGQVRLIPGVGLHTEKYHPPLEQDVSLRAELGIPEKAFHIVSAGELNRNKNHRAVIEALAQLGCDDIYYSICGEGPYRKELEQLIRERGLQDRVFLHGYWYDMPRMYASADLCVFPSLREGLGMAALEAMAMGIPLIAADNRGTREYMEDGTNGTVCRPESPDEFARAIRTLYENPALRKEFARNAQTTVQKFTIEHTTEQMCDIYDLLPREAPFVRHHARPGDPVISVIMGVYNMEDTGALEHAVQSILGQSVTNFEFLIYNDGADTKVTGILRTMAQADARIHLLESEENHGLGYALNRCIEAARGRYLARMDADDVSFTERFRVELEFLEEHPQYMWCGTNCEIFDRDGVWAKGTRPENPDVEDYLRYSPYIHPTVMFRAEVFECAGGYAEDRETARCEDYELFMRLFCLGFLGCNIQQTLFRYYVDRENYHKRPFKYHLYESHVRGICFRQMGLGWRRRWMYMLRPIAGALLPVGLITKHKERIADL